MFTGLIERTGTVNQISSRGDGADLGISLPVPWTDALVPGESVCVQGACLTVTSASDDGFACDVLKETLNRTTLAQIRPGAILNLERAMKANDRLGGHIVSGHVDGTGEISAIRNSGADHVLKVSCDPALTAQLVEKGSVACDGVSLTVVDVGENFYSVHVIPTTWSTTTLGTVSVGTRVNVEIDIVSKYVQRHLARLQSANSTVTVDDLRNAGFLT